MWKFIRNFCRDLFGINGTEPMVGGYRADYSALSNDEIAAPAPGDELFKSGDWKSVNRHLLK